MDKKARQYGVEAMAAAIARGEEVTVQIGLQVEIADALAAIRDNAINALAALDNGGSWDGVTVNAAAQKSEDLDSRPDLKQQLDAIEVPYSMQFKGAGWLAVIVNDTTGKALGIKKDPAYGCIYWSASDNGNFPYLEDKVNEIVRAHNARTGADVKVKIRLT